MLTIISIFIFTILVIYFADIYPKNTHYSIFDDFIIIFILSFFILFPIIRSIRYAYVMRAYLVLYFPLLIFTIIISVFALGIFKIKQGTLVDELNSILPFLIILTSMILYIHIY